MATKQATGSNIFEWLWQARRMKAYRALNRGFPGKYGEYLERAKLAHREAVKLCDEPPHNRDERFPLLAIQLFAESLYWSLTAEARATAPLDSDFALPKSLSQVLSRGDVEVETHIPDAKLRSAVISLAEASLAAPGFAPENRSIPVESALRDLSTRVVEHADRAGRGIERIWFERTLRVALPLILVLVGVMGARIARAQIALGEETSYPWVASSASGERGCISPRQGCEQDHFFFHTRQEPQPWVTFDLGKAGTVSSVTIANRTDCRGCSERAVPLVIEVSDDGKNYRKVAQRKRDFVTWKASFPRQQARFLRLRVNKRTFLHLKQVRIER